MKKSFSISAIETLSRYIYLTRTGLKSFHPGEDAVPPDDNESHDRSLDDGRGFLSQTFLTIHSTSIIVRYFAKSSRREFDHSSTILPFFSHCSVLSSYCPVDTEIFHETDSFESIEKRFVHKRAISIYKYNFERRRERERER